MHLENLHLINFKNYEEADIKLSSGINCFVGNNGAGKNEYPRRSALSEHL